MEEEDGGGEMQTEKFLSENAETSLSLSSLFLRCVAMRGRKRWRKYSRESDKNNSKLKTPLYFDKQYHPYILVKQYPIISCATWFAFNLRSLLGTFFHACSSSLSGVRGEGVQREGGRRESLNRLLPSACMQPALP